MKAILKISVFSTALLFSSLAFYSVPTWCEAAVTPVRIVQQIVVFSMPQNCEAGVMEQLCSSVASFLDDEAAKADTALKNCTKNCGWKKRKDDLVKAAQKKAKDTCSKGEVPDINELSKWLDTDAKTRLKNLYDRNSRMFDGTANLAAKDLTPLPSNSAATLTGAGGQVADLKTAEPATPKLNTASEFSLSRTKLSGETSNQATTKQSPVLLASASTAKPPSDTTASENSALSPQKALAASDSIIPMVRECKCYYGSLFMEVGEEGIPGSVCEEWKKKNCCPQNQTMAATGCSASCKAGTGFFGFYTNWRHNSAGETANCGSKCFNPETKCCVNGTLVAKCGSACWNPVVECCQDGKVYPGKTLYLGKCMTICEAILGRIGRINIYIDTWEANPNYTIEGDPNSAVATNYAETFCWKLKGPEIKYYEAFYSLDPELQKAITAHENVHALQCKSYTLLGMTYYWKDKELLKKGFPGPFEIPAHEVEREILKNAADKLHCQ
ncbi:MAG: hypothetical protein HY796_03015 [Elusimicrobia bacterium]|nr:hypothetical protein [Elusimicrobiota bacterium]